MKVYDSLLDLLTSSDNYARYRRRLALCEGFRFPALGVHLKDLMALHVALPDWSNKTRGVINISKMRQVYKVVQELTEAQRLEPPVKANSDLLNLLTVRHFICDRNAIFKLKKEIYCTGLYTIKINIRTLERW